MAAITGAGLLMVKTRAVGDCPPPGAGLDTLTKAAPAAATSAARTEAVSIVEEMKPVSRFWPFQSTVAPCTKPEPITVMPKSRSPTVACAGLRPVTSGAGFAISARRSVGDAAPESSGRACVAAAVAASARQTATVMQKILADPRRTALPITACPFDGSDCTHDCTTTQRLRLPGRRPRSWAPPAMLETCPHEETRRGGAPAAPRPAVCVGSTGPAASAADDRRRTTSP